MSKWAKSRDYQQDWGTFWKEICENPDGSLNKEQVMKELYDFRMLMDNISKLYCSLSGNKISKPTTMPFEVFNEFENQLTERYDEGYNDGRSDGFDDGYETGREGNEEK